MADSETASARESRLAQERQREEVSPSLIGQLKLIREEWGEGFDEDVAKPLALLILRLRKQLEAWKEEQDGELADLQNQLDELEQTVEENSGAAETLRSLEDDLADVPRGIRTVEEVIEKYAAVP